MSGRVGRSRLPAVMPPQTDLLLHPDEAMLILEVLTLGVLIWTLLVVQRYTRATVRLTNTTEDLHALEKERRYLERESFLRDHDLNLEFQIPAIHNDKKKATRLVLNNVGGPVTDVRLYPGGQIEIAQYNRKGKWYQNIGYIDFRFLGQEETSPRLFQFTATYKNKFKQERTKSFTVYTVPEGVNQINEIETVPGTYPEHLSQIGEFVSENELLALPDSPAQLENGAA